VPHRWADKTPLRICSSEYKSRSAQNAILACPQVPGERSKARECGVRILLEIVRQAEPSSRLREAILRQQVYRPDRNTYIFQAQLQAAPQSETSTANLASGPCANLVAYPKSGRLE